MNEKMTVNYTDLLLPYTLVEIETYQMHFLLTYVWFHKLKMGEFVQAGDPVGQFAIAYKCEGLDADFLINMDVNDALRFYKELVFLCHDKRNAASLDDAKGRTHMDVVRADSGYLEVNAFFKNKNSLYASGIEFHVSCTQKVFKKALLRFEYLFRELVRLDCLEDNTDF